MEKIDTWMKKATRFPGSNDTKKWYMDSYADFGGSVGKVYDYQVADYAKKHLRFIDRFNLRKVATAMIWSFSILSQSIEEPNIKNGKWKFYVDF